MPYRTDYHIHTKYSDGEAAPEDYIPSAISAGLSEIGFSEHLSLFRENQDWVMEPEIIYDYIIHIENLKKKVKNISIRTGLEIDFLPGKEKELDRFLSCFDLDYRIGSVHYMGDETVDLGPEFYDSKDIDKLFESYIRFVIAASSSGLFDIIGHCDLIRIFGHQPHLDPEPLYRELARTMNKYDVVFELNTNGKNKAVGGFYPDPRFLYVFREENVSVCVNSDAHIPSRVGQYFDDAYKLLKTAGFTEMAVFEERKRKMMPL